jgi:hypothetical protein
MWDYSDVYKKNQFAFSYVTLHEWTYKKLKGKKLKTFFDDCGIRTIAVYSLGSLGKVFVDEACEEKLDIKYIVDRNPKMLPSEYNGIKIVDLNDIMLQENVDAIVICHVYYYNQIADELVKLGIPESKLYSMNDVVFTL